MKADYELQTAEFLDLLTQLMAEQKELANGIDQQYPALTADTAIMIIAGITAPWSKILPMLLIDALWRDVISTTVQ